MRAGRFLALLAVLTLLALLVQITDVSMDQEGQVPSKRGGMEGIEELLDRLDRLPISASWEALLQVNLIGGKALRLAELSLSALLGSATDTELPLPKCRLPFPQRPLPIPEATCATTQAYQQFIDCLGIEQELLSILQQADLGEPALKDRLKRVRLVIADDHSQNLPKQLLSGLRAFLRT